MPYAMENVLCSLFNCFACFLIITSSFPILGLCKSTLYLACFCHPEMNCFVLSASLRIPSHHFKQNPKFHLRTLIMIIFIFGNTFNMKDIICNLLAWEKSNLNLLGLSRAIQLQYNRIWTIFICTNFFWSDIIWTKNSSSFFQNCCYTSLMWIVYNYWLSTRNKELFNVGLH